MFHFDESAHLDLFYHLKLGQKGKESKNLSKRALLAYNGWGIQP
jgi:hypothetical protein